MLYLFFSQSNCLQTRYLLVKYSPTFSHITSKWLLSSLPSALAAVSIIQQVMGPDRLLEAAPYTRA